MTVRYHQRRGQLVPDYVCCIRTLQHRDPPCQVLPGGAVDRAIGRLIVTTLTPFALELTLAVQAELETRLDEADRLRGQQIERALHEAELARRRYLQVDPTHRLVAASLEADWNDRLRAVAETRERVEHQRDADRGAFDEQTRQRIRDLAADVPAVWDDPATPPRERKRILGLLLEDVTLARQDDEITLAVRFRGGATTTLRVPLRIGPWRGRKTHPQVVARAATLLASHTAGEVAARLNAEGFTSGAGLPFKPDTVEWMGRHYGLTSRRDHLRAAGHLTAVELAARLRVSVARVGCWRAEGRLTGARCNQKDWLYDPIERQSAWIRERAACEDRPLDRPCDNRTITAATRGAV